jgi:tRNA (guanine26-N2/guanine27-N2)-dimethyltransferase
MPVFYNPVMEFNRDLSILVVEQFLNEKTKNNKSNVKLLDGLAGTGARGIRMASEVEMPRSIKTTFFINDHNPLAFNLIEKNIKQNDISNAKALNSDLNSVLVKNWFDYIDIDPFGSPINFIDSGTRMLRNKGILAVTATDTATLFGTFPKTCLRRYDAWSDRTKFGHEIGPRILIGSCVRFAAKHNLGLEPLLIHSTDHYYRIYLRGVKGRWCADKSLENMGYILKFERSNEFKIIKAKDFFLKNLEFSNQFTSIKKKAKYKIAGPLWIGAIFNAEFVKSLKIGTHKFGTKAQLTKLLPIWLEESASPPGYYDANQLASELKISTPQLNTILESLKNDNYIATRTHFNFNAFKTNASFEVICTIMKKLAD